MNNESQTCPEYCTFRPSDKVMGYIPSLPNPLIAGEITEITEEAGVRYYVDDSARNKSSSKKEI